MNSFYIIFEGLKLNILITVLSCIIPIAIGFVVTNLSKNNTALFRPIKAFGYVFESFSPILLIVVLFYCVFFHWNRMLLYVISFTLAFMGYIPSKLQEEHSFIKDFAVNSVGLLSHAFKWSFCVRILGEMELLGFMTRNIQKSYQTGIVWVGLIISFVIVFALNMVKFILEERLD